MGLKVGICGVGNFGSLFVHVFQKHPDVDEVYLADVRPEPLAEAAKKNGVRKTFPSLEELLKSDCDCVALFTQRWKHAPQAIQALKAGKHVYSAVPAGVTLDELFELVETVKSTGKVYMLGETSYYRAQTTYCRERFAKGDFGRFVYGEGQYHHDMAHFYRGYMNSNGDEWKATASFPPMYYPTHSVAFVLGVTFSRMTEVSCFGYVDEHPDGVFDPKLSLWQNAFSNESGLFRTADGGMARINEFRRVGAGDPDNGRMTLMGTHAAYEEQPLSAVWTNLEFPKDYGKNGIPFANAHELVPLRKQEVNHIHRFDGVEITEANLGELPKKFLGRKYMGVSQVQPYRQLPYEFTNMSTGHGGTHLFLVNDFVRSVVRRALPPNHVWLAARYNAPGFVAHESAKRGGELLKIPDFGMPPASWPKLEETYALKP